MPYARSTVRRTAPGAGRDTFELLKLQCVVELMNKCYFKRHVKYVKIDNSTKGKIWRIKIIEIRAKNE